MRIFNQVFKRKNIISWLFFAGVAAIICFSAFQKPLYNWDLLPYSAAALSYEIDNPAQLHELTYESARSILPPAKFNALVDSNSNYRLTMYSDSKLFEDELKYYYVKPLYVFAVFLFYKAGVSLPSGTVLVSCISLFLLGCILFQWIGVFLNRFVAAAICFLVLLIPPIYESARLSTPDMMNTLFLFAGFYALLKTKKISQALIFFIAALLTRPDSCLFILCLIPFCISGKKIPANYLFIVLAFTVCITASLIYYFSFPVNSLGSNIKATEMLHLNGENIYWQSYSKGLQAIHYSYILYLGSITLIALCLSVFVLKETIKSDLNFTPILVWIHVIIFYLIHPVIDDRFFIIDYIIAFVLLINVVSKLFRRKTAALVEIRAVPQQH
jgi:hypothetical protein